MEARLQTKFTISLPRAFAIRLLWLHRNRGNGCDVDSFASEWLQVSLADVKLQPLKVECPLAPRGEVAPARTEGSNGHREPLQPETVQEILHMRTAEGMSTAMLSRRFRIAASSISRILKKYEAAPQHRRNSTEDEDA